MTEKVSIFIGKNIGIRHEIESVSPKLLLHFDIIEAQPVFPSNFIRMWEVVQSLILVQTFIKISFTTTTRPQQIPLMRFSITEAIGFTETPHKLSVSFKYLVQELTVINMATRSPLPMMAVSRGRRSIHQQLGFVNIFEINIFSNTTFYFVCLGILE